MLAPGAALALLDIAYGVKTFNSPRHAPFFMSFFIATIRLWRICFALFPEPLTTAPMRALPILLLFGAMFYWLWKVRSRRTLAVLVRDESMPLG
jgi:hypothetical protein